MGLALLLRWRRLLGLVLRLSLRAQDIGFVDIRPVIHVRSSRLLADLKGVDKFKFDFVLGKPFKPFEQLMGVLPDLSSQHIPEAYRVSYFAISNLPLLMIVGNQDLMTDSASPIIDFYPRNFETDLNGKKQDWEAIVKIPFMDEKRLLKTMAGMS